MKILIENYGKKYTIEVDHDDLSIVEYVDIINSMLLSIGFHQDTITEGFKEFIN
jgi:uncharacterized membrane protein